MLPVFQDVTCGTNDMVCSLLLHCSKWSLHGVFLVISKVTPMVKFGETVEIQTSSIARERTLLCVSVGTDGRLKPVQGLDELIAARF